MWLGYCKDFIFLSFALRLFTKSHVHFKAKAASNMFDIRFYVKYEINIMSFDL